MEKLKKLSVSLVKGKKLSNAKTVEHLITKGLSESITGEQTNGNKNTA
tara:strand:+ start:630 stop:773 length:144 start_codon:yes stop_codon:yes gene_type:complete